MSAEVTVMVLLSFGWAIQARGRLASAMVRIEWR